MSNQFEPPLMPNYPATMDELFQVFAPYFHDQQPLDLFFEFYIIDVIGSLPVATDSAMNQLIETFPVFFASTGGNWRQGIVQELNLSDTIDIAILDLWFRNSATAKKDGWVYHPWHYAKSFLDNYMAENSLIDVWEGDALALAKARISAHRVVS